MDITNIDINPITHPQAFFGELDNRILKEVQGAQIACEQHSREAMLNHLTHMSDLLTLAHEHSDDFLKAYKEKKQVGAKRDCVGLSPEEQSLEAVFAFKKQTQSLIEVLKDTSQEEISTPEWQLMRELFQAFKPGIVTKKSKPSESN